jgi:hypothetical protein
MLDQQKKRAIDETRDIDISNSYVYEKGSYLRKTKKTLLIFRRVSQKKAKCTLELRHQRTCDVCFDWAIQDDSTAVNPEEGEKSLINNDGIKRTDLFKPNEYIYKMIETMLPKAMVTEQTKHIRLLEM